MLRPRSAGTVELKTLNPEKIVVAMERRQALHRLLDAVGQ
jgi:hypothetical protein